MKRFLKIMLISILVLVCGIDLYFQRVALADFDMDGYNREYQNIFEDNKTRSHKYYQSFLAFVVYMEFFAAKQTKKELLRMSWRFDYYVSFQRKTTKDSGVTVRPVWDTSYINFYALSSKEKERLDTYLAEWRTSPTW